MSDQPASELLTELGMKMLGDPALSYDANAQASFTAALALRSALPLIVDVVVAAEAGRDYWETTVRETMPGLDPWDERHSTPESRQLVAALTALREALE